MPYIPEGKVKEVTDHLVKSGLPYIQALALAQLFDAIYKREDTPDAQ